MHHVFGTIIFTSFACSLLFIIPIVKREKQFYEEVVADSGESFQAYLNYRFMDWFTQQQVAPSLVLLFITLSLIVTGAIAYSLLVGGSPSHALWRIFVWSTSSPAEGEVTPGGRFLGTIVTVCGLIILSLLLGIVSEIFSSKMNEIKSGQLRVVEGGHVVILGFTECTRCLIEELAKACESEGGGVFVVLAHQDKECVEAELSDDLDLRGSRIIVRAGNPCHVRDLSKVAAASAAKVVVLADTDLSQEQGDAKSIRTLLSLKTKGWPTNGRIVVQCSSDENRDLFKTVFYPESDKVEVVVVGNIVATLMAKSGNQPGLATVFGQMLGFDGDEFYIEEWPELVGCAWREVFFRFPDAVALGVITDEGECKLNPGWEYEILAGDRVVVLAEDNDTYKPCEKPWYETDKDRVFLCAGAHTPYDPRGFGMHKILIIGWNNKMGPLLKALDEEVVPGATIDIFSCRDADARREEVAKVELTLGHKFENFTITQLEVDVQKLTSQHELANLQHYTYDGLFLLADDDCSRAVADERVLAHVSQLRHINRKRDPKNCKPFPAVIEMCEDSTSEHLRISQCHNVVHSSSMVSQALAAVTEDPSVNSIYADLMSGHTNQFEFRRLIDFFDGSPPEKISYWEIAYQVSQAENITVVAWSKPKKDNDDQDNGSPVFEINPKDKSTQRLWTPDDRIAVIRRLDGSRSS